MISSRDPELCEEQRKLRKFGKGLNVSIIGPRKKITADWKRIPPGFSELLPPAADNDNNSTHDVSNRIESSANPFTFGFM
jgi:hypothetical protein